MLAPYLPILLLFLLALGFATFSVVIAPFTGPRRYNKAKLDFYECGIEPTPQPLGPSRFPIKYYLTAMLFIVFDIEIIMFVVTVFAAYAYVWRRGGLDWD